MTTPEPSTPPSYRPANTPTIPPTTSVLLEHTLPDGSAHFDWLIERPHTGHTTQPEHRMITFRCEGDPLDRKADWTGIRLPDHRAHYIEYEGLVSGGRGTVGRIWRTPCRLIDEQDASVRLLIEHPADRGRLHITIARDRRHPDAIDATSTWTIDIARHPKP